MIISGNTGTGKTGVLKRLRKEGGQIIDLEGLANHRGSIFGGYASKQPSQKTFESRLAKELRNLSNEVPIFLESESSKIGFLKIPPGLWSKMKKSPFVELRSALNERSKYLVSDYPDLYKNIDILTKKIRLLNPYHNKKTISDWCKLAANKDFELLASQLIEKHYDPKYGTATNYLEKNKLFDIKLNPSNIDELKNVAKKLLAQVIKTPPPKL